jgi:hypothetical protein
MSLSEGRSFVAETKSAVAFVFFGRRATAFSVPKLQWDKPHQLLSKK